MEPFAPYGNLFPGFPDRHIYLDISDAELESVVRETYTALPSRKYSLLHRRGGSLGLRRFDQIISSAFTLAARLPGISLPQRINAFQVLNLNAASTPPGLWAQKDSAARVAVTKELRLNFKLRLLASVFPEAKLLITVRDPGAQVTSIVNRIQGGSLIELNQSLSRLLQYTKHHPRFEKYSALPSHEPGATLIQQLLHWWLINYEVLIEDCRALGIDHRIVFHERISHDPEEEFEVVLSFLGLTHSDAVREYIRRSSRGGSRMSASSLDTIRDSASHSDATIEAVTQDVNDSIIQLYGAVDALDELQIYAPR